MVTGTNLGLFLVLKIIHPDYSFSYRYWKNTLFEVKEDVFYFYFSFLIGGRCLILLSTVKRTVILYRHDHMLSSP